MTARKTNVAIANAFGTLGYISAAIQWGWSVIILAYPWFTTCDRCLIPAEPREVDPMLIPSIPPVFTPYAFFAALAVTAAILALTVLIIIKLPKQVGRQGAKLTHSTAAVMLPAITGNHPISEKKRIKLSFQLVTACKLFLVIIPLVALIFSPDDIALPSRVILVVGAFCALCTTGYFAVQLLLVKLLRLDRTRIW